MDAPSRELLTAKLAAHFSGARDPVFATATGTALSARNATRGLASTIEKAQLPGVTFHVLRHTFASILIAQGRDPAFVADQLGHEDAAFTWRTYVHLFRAAQQAAAARERLDTDFGHLIRGAQCTRKAAARMQPGVRVGVRRTPETGRHLTLFDRRRIRAVPHNGAT